MKFRIDRTSHYSFPERPICKGAQKEVMRYIDSETIDRVERWFVPEQRDRWYSEGNNHRKESNLLARELDKDVDTICLSSLGELASFVEDNGRVIIEKDDRFPDCPFSIEIYDDFRE